MKFLLQRVSNASVLVSGALVGATKPGAPALLVLVGFGHRDTEELIIPALKKLTELRVFSDEKGRFDLSLKDVKGSLLLVPQFTLYADTTKGRRPDFFSAMPPKEAEILFDKLVAEAKSILGVDNVSQGEFGKEMQVSLINEGPVTIMLEF